MTMTMAMSRLCLRVSVVALLLSSAGSMAEPEGPVEFRCGDGGSLLISKIPGGGIYKSRKGVATDGSRRSIQMGTVVIECGDASMFCLREGVDPMLGGEQTHVLAVPRRIASASAYEASGSRFQVGPFRRVISGRMRTTITAAASANSGPYSLDVEDGRGIVAVRFHALISPVGSRRQLEWRFDDSTCAVDDDESGLFPDVRLIPESPPKP